MSNKGLNVKRTWGGITKLNELIKKEQNSKVKERLQTVLWRLKNEKYTEICKRLNRDKNTVSNWIKRWNKEGYEGLFDKPKSGRPTTLTIKEQEKVLNSLENREIKAKITCKLLSFQVKEEFGKDLTDEALRLFLHKHNLSWKKPKKKDYRQNEQKRQEYQEALKKRLKILNQKQWSGI